MTKRRLTRQERRSALDVPGSAFDAECDAFDDREDLEEFWAHYDWHNPWFEYDPPEWVYRARFDPDTYWHPWAECGDVDDRSRPVLVWSHARSARSQWQN